LSAQSHAGHQCLRAAPVGPASTAAKSTRMESFNRRKYLPILCPIGLAYVVKAADEETLTRDGCGASACPVRRGAKGARGTDECGQFNPSLSPLPTLLNPCTSVFIRGWHCFVSACPLLSFRVLL